MTRRLPPRAWAGDNAASRHRCRWTVRKATRSTRIEEPVMKGRRLGVLLAAAMILLAVPATDSTTRLRTLFANPPAEFSPAPGKP